MNSRSNLRRVQTSFGIVEGEIVYPGVDGLPPVVQFLGIPYGMAPTGQSRFNMVRSAPKWSNIPKQTTHLKSVCIQELPELSTSNGLKLTSTQRFDFMHRMYPKLAVQSEDCLYMNLYVPTNPDARKSKLSTLVIVHGDDYSWSAGSPYNGTLLSSFGDIIVVTLNYRLGVFGFLGRCQGSCVGNWALSDLVTALNMLSNIIESFDGDRNSITLLGWGSGASLVSLLMASPMTFPKTRLFKRAILLDGTALAPWAMMKRSNDRFYHLAHELKCADIKLSNKNVKSIESILQCMQDHSTENVTQAARKIPSPTFLSKFGPIVDGQAVPHYPKRIFNVAYGNLFRDIDLLVGLTVHPAHHLMADDFYKYGMTKEDRKKILRTLVRNLYDYHRNEILAAIIKEYTDWDNPREHPRKIRDGVLAALSDALFIAPLIDTARLHSTTLGASKHKSNTYMFVTVLPYIVLITLCHKRTEMILRFVFTHETKSQMKEKPNSGIFGSITGDHIPYIFGYPLLNFEEQVNSDLFVLRILKLYSDFTEIDKGISRVMMNYISNFVRSGDPSKPQDLTPLSSVEEKYGHVPWLQFNQANRESYIEIADRPRARNYYRNARVGFWNEFLPQLFTPVREDIAVPEEHNYLPDHFKKDTFYGVVRPHAPFLNEPFIAPPPSPPPFPNIKRLTTPAAITTAKPSQPISSNEVTVTQNSTMLSVTVAVGCGLLLLNICVGLGLYRQCNNRRDESKKKLQLQYQSYATNMQPNSDLNYGIATPLGQQQLEIMPPIHMQNHFPSIDNTSMEHHNSEVSSHVEYDLCRQNYQTYNNSQQNPLTTNFFEQEPLLPLNNKTGSSTGSTHLRTAVSPSCPKHGRAAMLATTSAHSTTLQNPASANAAPTLEEIQV
uniref:COesterase domain-containing protein n=1 Tax=Syphacia muris TaxID=451379 RepID=A0A0N5AJH8_9BILA